MRTREKVREFVAQNPCATYREIQRGCGLSSVSQVSHHLKMMHVDGRPTSEVIEENASLRRQVKKLKARLRQVAEIADVDD